MTEPENPALAVLHDDLSALWDLCASLQGQQDALSGQLGRFERHVFVILNRLELTMAAVDDKLNDLTGAVGDAATALDQLRAELADAAQPGDLTPDQAARFDAVISSLRNAVSPPPTV